MNHIPLLIVDDDAITRELLSEVFAKEDFDITLAGSGEEALAIIKNKNFSIVLSDIRMASVDGLELLANVKQFQPNTLVVLMTGFGNMQGAVRAIQEGAFDYISKPFRIEEMKSLIARARRQWISAAKEPARMVEHRPIVERSLIGRSRSIIDVYKSLARAALSSSSVLITGESGTGKELVARAIHENSARKNKQFMAINCGSLSDSLLESELFGHVKGAFTGAFNDKRGLLEETSGGTLFLDEVGDVSPALQVRLLRVLQEGEFKPVGANEIRKTDLRVIAATHRNLDEMIRMGKFRDDLYYRLKVIEISLPPLRERMEDLPDLVGHFIAKFSGGNSKSVSHISDGAMDLLRAHHWPGNIRELEHVIERAVAMSRSSVLFPEDFSGLVRERNLSQSPVDAKNASSLEQMERAHIIRVLKEVSFNKSKASGILGIDRATLYRKAQRYGISLESDRGL